MNTFNNLEKVAAYARSMLEYSLALMAKSKSKSTNAAQVNPEVAVAAADTVRRLVVTVPILIAVLFTIGYLQMGIQPITDRSTNQTAQQATKAVLVANTPALQIAPQTQEKLAPLAVTVTESPLNSNASGIGDTKASAAAQPTAPSPQSPQVSASHSKDNGLQAREYSGDTNEL